MTHRYPCLAPLLTALVGAVQAHSTPSAPGLEPGGTARIETTRAGAPRDETDPIVARARGLTLRASEVDPVLLNRYGLSENGRELLKILVGSGLIDRLAAERKIRATPEDIRQAWERLDAEIRSSGVKDGLLGQLEDQNMEPEEFREYLRTTVLHERLTRLALEIDEDAPLSARQQELWLQREKDARGAEILPPPWPDGIVARCGEIEVDTHAFGELLRRRLPPDDVKETAWHCLLLKGIEIRMPDVSEQARARGIEAEIVRRKKTQERVSPSVTFEQLLAARGRTLGMLSRDPSVGVAVMARLWVDRTSGMEGLRETYENERAWFEGRYGKAVRTHLMFLVASRYRNQLNPRTFQDAKRELERMIASVGNSDDFAALCREFSEEPKTREKNGELGFVTREDPRCPEVLREAIFARADSPDPLPTEGVAVGPLQLDTGCAVLWLSAIRESPPWEVMAEHVHEELRRRFLESVILQGEVELVR